MFLAALSTKFVAHVLKQCQISRRHFDIFAEHIRVDKKNSASVLFYIFFDTIILQNIIIFGQITQ